MGILAGIVFALSMQTADAHRIVVAARHIAAAPGGLDDPVWGTLPVVPIPVKGRNESANDDETVWTTAAYTDETLYFLFRWKDPTLSVIKQSWYFDGSAWHHLEGNEDRIALLFEITRITNFATRGCAVTCHSPVDLPRERWKLATRTEREKGDLWHWKAARSAPHGHADDAWLTVAGNPTGSYRETGRRKDKGSGGDIKNQTGDKSGPLYMQDPKRPPSAPGFLLLEEAVEIKDYSIFKAGDVIPFRLPRYPSGSRSDVKSVSRHGGGEWLVMLYRKLDTGHDDDTIFNPLKKYNFAIAIFDNSGADHSKATQPLTLEFER